MGQQGMNANGFYRCSAFAQVVEWQKILIKRNLVWFSRPRHTSHPAPADPKRIFAVESQSDFFPRRPGEFLHASE